jgi:hypothetical protein
MLEALPRRTGEHRIAAAVELHMGARYRHHREVAGPVVDNHNKHFALHSYSAGTEVGDSFGE